MKTLTVFLSFLLGTSYLFSQAQDPSQLVNLILDRTGETANFSLRPMESGMAQAVLENEERFILYNQAYLENLPADVLRMVVLSQAIGHHINEHRFLPAFAESEVLTAAEFTGYALYNLNAQRELLAILPQLVPEIVSSDTVAWIAALEQGYDRAEAALLAAPFSGYDDDGTGTTLAGVPEFPIPPPAPSASHDLTDFFKESQYLGDISEKLIRALETYGYYENRFFHVKNGFALVTRIEQFNADGSCRSGKSRWSIRPVREETFSWGKYLNYLKSLFIADVSYFRVFAFIVTPENWAPDPNRKVSKEEASGWLDMGANRLPPIIAQKEVSHGTGVSILIYEFKVPEVNREVIMSRPSDLTAVAHLEKSQLMEEIRK